MATKKNRRAAKSDAPKSESIVTQAAIIALALGLWFGLPYLLGTLYQMGMI